MTATHPGKPTRPLLAGAPLPPKTDLEIDPQDIGDELARAETELLYALARHRKAWQSMARHLNERAELAGRPGALAAIDSDPTWKHKTGDVAWWRDEVTCQATAVTALTGMLERHESVLEVQPARPGWMAS